MSHQNGTPQGMPPQPPTRAEIRFNNPLSMFAYFLADRAVADLNSGAAQARALGQTGIADFLGGKAVEVAAARDEILRVDQGGIILAGPGSLPRT